MFQDKDLNLLTRLGFTNSQAKIYLSLIHLGQSTAHDIVKVAQTDRAETYRVISQLEKQGCVQRIIANPSEFKAIPVSELLSVLLLRKKAEVCELEKEAKRLRKKRIENVRLAQEEYMLLAPKTEMVLDSIKQTPNPERTINMISTLGGCRKSAIVLRDILLAFIKKGTKVTLIVDKPVEAGLVPKPVKDLESHPNFALMYATRPVMVPVVIMGNTEVWINTSERFNFLEGAHLISNNPRLISLAQGYFNHMLSVSVSAKKLKPKLASI
ncbi:MAG: hypothetical protein NWF00_09285 [Candidatus Bathyarchaeota archaeon]|nr:hypothetical protein [Candidatus Bathyarchaeota archaeon]